MPGRRPTKDHRYPNRLREWRERRGLTLKELAAKTRDAWQNIQRYETGERKLTVEDLPRFAKALGIEQADFLNTAFAARDERERRVIEMIRRLAEADQERLLTLAIALVDLAERREDHPQEPGGETPPVRRRSIRAGG